MKAIRTTILLNFRSVLNHSLTAGFFLVLILMIGTTPQLSAQEENKPLQLIEQLKDGTLVVLLNTEPNKIKYINVRIAELRNSDDPKAGKEKATYENMLARILKEQRQMHERLVSAFDKEFNFGSTVLFVVDTDWKKAQDSGTLTSVSIQDGSLVSQEVNVPSASFIFKEGRTKSQHAKEGFILLDPYGEIVPKPLPNVTSNSFSTLFRFKSAELRLAKKFNSQLKSAYKRLQKTKA